MYPSECVEVIEYIRRHVAKPDSLPKSSWLGSTNLRWPGGFGWCPMGLCRTTRFAIVTAQMAAEDTGLSREAVYAFMDWWDCETDAAAAVEAVWGEAK